MKHAAKFTRATTPPSMQGHRPVGPPVLAVIIGMVSVFRAIVLEYRTAIAAEEAYRKLRYFGDSELARSVLRHYRQAIVIKRLFCGHDQ